MSEDLTDKLPKSNGEILTAIKNIENCLGKIDTRLESLEKKVGGLENKVGGVEKKVDERLFDTRPIWQKVVADIGELQAGQQRLEAGQKRLEENQSVIREHIIELHTVTRTASRDQIVFNDAIRHMQVDFQTIAERLFKLTMNQNQQNSST